MYQDVIKNMFSTNSTQYKSRTIFSKFNKFHRKQNEFIFDLVSDLVYSFTFLCYFSSQSVAVITPVVSVNNTLSAIYPCDSQLVLRQFSYFSNSIQSYVCWGVVLLTNDDYYDAQGKQIKNITLNLTNYTQVVTIENGNLSWSNLFVLYKILVF